MGHKTQLLVCRLLLRPYAFKDVMGGEKQRKTCSVLRYQKTGGGDCLFVKLTGVRIGLIILSDNIDKSNDLRNPLLFDNKTST